MEQLGRLLKQNPPLYLGFVLLAFAFLHTNGSSVSGNNHASIPLAVFGVVLLAIGLVLLVRELRRLDEERRREEERSREKPRFKDPACHEAPFWHEVFDAMPPAFIKAVDDTRRIEDLPHIAESNALGEFQGRGQPEGRASIRPDRDWDLIRAGFDAGDRGALDAKGKCRRFLESSDTFGINPERQILTVKTAIEYGGRRFIVGWFVPVKLPKNLSKTYNAKETGHQITFSMIEAVDGKGIRTTVLEPARRAARKRSKPA